MAGNAQLAGRWSLDAKESAARDRLHAALPADAANRKAAFLASDEGKALVLAYEAGLRSDLELRQDGTFSWTLGALPMDPAEPRVMQTGTLSGTWARSGDRLTLTLAGTKPGDAAAKSTAAFAYDGDHLVVARVQGAEADPWIWTVLSRR